MLNCKIRKKIFKLFCKHDYLSGIFETDKQLKYLEKVQSKKVCIYCGKIIKGKWFVCNCFGYPSELYKLPRFENKGSFINVIAREK